MSQAYCKPAESRTSSAHIDSCKPAKNRDAVYFALRSTLVDRFKLPQDENGPNFCLPFDRIRDQHLGTRRQPVFVIPRIRFLTHEVVESPSCTPVMIYNFTSDITSGTSYTQQIRLIFTTSHAGIPGPNCHRKPNKEFGPTTNQIENGLRSPSASSVDINGSAFSDRCLSTPISSGYERTKA